MECDQWGKWKSIEESVPVSTSQATLLRWAILLLNGSKQWNLRGVDQLWESHAEWIPSRTDCYSSTRWTRSRDWSCKYWHRKPVSYLANVNLNTNRSTHWEMAPYKNSCPQFCREGRSMVNQGYEEEALVTESRSSGVLMLALLDIDNWFSTWLK